MPKNLLRWKVPLAVVLPVIALQGFISVVPLVACPKCSETGAWVGYRQARPGEPAANHVPKVFPGQCDICGGKGKLALFRKWTTNEGDLQPTVRPQ